MTNNPRTPTFFVLWIDLNKKLWNSWATCYSFPLKLNVLNSAFFEQIASWTAWIDRCLELEFTTVLAPAEQLFRQPSIQDEASADALLEDIRQSSEYSLPDHTEFDTLIYPWHEAEQSVPAQKRRPIYTGVRNVA